MNAKLARPLMVAGLLGGIIPATTIAQQPPGKLPAVPRVHGALRMTVVYPAAGAHVTSADSIFLFGTAGDGDARVTVAGQRAMVAPNGAWVAWIGVPPDSAFVVIIGARLGADTATVSLPLSHAGWVRQHGAWVDRASLTPVGDVRIPPDGSILLAVRGAPGARVRLLVPGKPPIAFAPDSTLDPVPEGIRDFDRDDRNLQRTMLGDRYVGTLPATAGAAAEDVFSPLSAHPSPTLEVVRGRDTTRIAWPLAIHRVATAGTAVMLDADPGRRGGIDRFTIGRAFPSGTYTWFLPPGTRAVADQRVGDELRLRLAQDAIAWIPAADAHPAGAVPALAKMGSLTLTALPGRSVLRIPLSYPVPLSVNDEDRSLTITLYGAVADANWTRYGAGQQFVRQLAWQQVAADRIQLTIEFDRPLWGWRVRVDGSDLVLDFRAPPLVDPAHPLSGRRIVIDPGHPPGGACGPTGLCEPEANLSVAVRIRDALVAAGAHVTLTRATASPIDLWPRVALADSLDADLLVSIHNNAFPDGVNPFTNNGSSTFFNHAISLDLARAIQAHLVPALGLRDLGVARGDLALVRPTWYPSVLVEGLFLMFPDQEAALRSPAGQQIYATAVVDGITDFLQRVTQPGPRH